SRISRGKIELRRESADLRNIISGAIEAVRPMVDGCAHDLGVTLPDEPLVIEADVARLVQVFGNILNNAAKYTGRGGIIRVVVGRENGQAVVCIRDNGP